VQLKPGPTDQVLQMKGLAFVVKRGEKITGPDNRFNEVALSAHPADRDFFSPAENVARPVVICQAALLKGLPDGKCLPVRVFHDLQATSSTDSGWWKQVRRRRRTLQVASVSVYPRLVQTH